ncbi:MAG: glycosyl hydrolase family 8 [Clostridiales bacterium]|nr:glycosyl hydrolase family 8 [Clostridiales bacterium]
MEKIIQMDFGFNYSCESSYEKLCRKFIEEKMQNQDGGIITNYKIAEDSRDVLSESEGLAMLYYVFVKDYEKFNMHYEFVNNNMILKTNLISWRVGDDFSYSSSAAIDDLRIIRALVFASNEFNNKDYQSLARKITKAVKKYETRNGYLVDYFDGYIKSDSITLSYIDLYTLKLMVNYDTYFETVYLNSRDVLDRGKIDGTPFYRNKYNLKTKTFSNERYVDILQNAIVVEHLVEDNIYPNDFYGFIKNEIEQSGAIYSKYDISTKRPVSKVESTAIYATLARIALYYKDIDLYKALINRMLKLQVKNISSQINGAYGDSRTLYAHSFDNLNALIALRMGGCYIGEEGFN